MKFPLTAPADVCVRNLHRWCRPSVCLPYRGSTIILMSAQTLASGICRTAGKCNFVASHAHPAKT